jgi:hypothetical protein
LRRLNIGKVEHRKFDAARGKNDKTHLGTIITSTTSSPSQRYNPATQTHNQHSQSSRHPRPSALDCADTLCTVETLLPRVPSLQLHATRASRDHRTFDSPRQPV